MYDGKSRSSSSVRLVFSDAGLSGAVGSSVPLPLWLQFRGQPTVMAGANTRAGIMADNDAQRNFTSQ